MWISMVFGEPQLCKDSVVVVSGVVRVFDERVAKVVVGLVWVLARARAARAALAARGCCRNSLSSESSLIGASRRGRRVSVSGRSVRCSEALAAMGGALVSRDLLTTLFELKRARGKIRPFRASGFFVTRLVEES